MSIVVKDHIKVNQYTRPASKLGVVKGIIMHYTANSGASAKNHQKYFNGTAIANKSYASAHIFIDDNDVIEIIPLNEVAYHANESGYSKVTKFKGNYGYSGSNANGCTIGIEMCIDAKGNITAKTLKNTLTTVVELCKKFNLDENDLFRHYDITGKNCPAMWVKDVSKFNDFKNDVKKALKGTTTASKPSTTKEPSKPEKASTGTLKILVNDLNYYSGARWTKPSGTVNKNEVFTVVGKVKVDGYDMYKLKSGNYITTNSKYVKFTAK